MGTSVLSVAVVVGVAVLFVVGPFAVRIFKVGFELARQVYKWGFKWKTAVIVAIWVLITLFNCFVTVPNDIRRQAESPQELKPRTLVQMTLTLPRDELTPLPKPLSTKNRAKKRGEMVSVPNPTPPNQSVPVAPPQQTFQERVTQKNRNLPKGDRERLSNAFYQFSETLNQGRALMYKGFHEGSAILNDGDITKDFPKHVAILRGLGSEAKEYGKGNMALRSQ